MPLPVIIDGRSSDGSLDRDFLRLHGVRGLLTKTDLRKLGSQPRVGYALQCQVEFTA